MIVIAFVLGIHRDDNPGHLSIYQRNLKLDLIGASIIIFATIYLLPPLQWGGSTNAYNSSHIIGLFAGVGCLACLFIYSQARLGDKGTLSPSLSINRNVLFAVLFPGAFGAAFYPLTLYLAIYFQSVEGSTALHAGIQLLPLAISTTVSSVFIGFSISALGYYTPIMLICMALLSIGAALFTTISLTTSYGIVCVCQTLTGLGMGVGFEAGIIVVQFVLPRSKAPEAISCVSFVMILAGAVSLPVAQALFWSGLLKGTQEYASHLHANLLLRSGATEFRRLLMEIGEEGALEVALTLMALMARDWRLLYGLQLLVRLRHSLQRLDWNGRVSRKGMKRRIAKKFPRRKYYLESWRTLLATYMTPQACQILVSVRIRYATHTSESWIAFSMSTSCVKNLYVNVPTAPDNENSAL